MSGLTDPLLSVDETAAMLGVTVNSVRHAHRRRTLRGVVVLGRLRFRQSAIEAFVVDLERYDPHRGARQDRAQKAKAARQAARRSRTEGDENKS